MGERSHAPNRPNRPNAPDRPITQTPETPDDGDGDGAREYLLTFLQDNTAALLGVIRAYVARFGLAQGADVSPAAHDVFQEVVVEALTHADRFASADPVRSPMAWLLGIAVNIIRRRQAGQTRQRLHERPISQFGYAQADPNHEAEALDHLLAAQRNGATDDPEQEIESAEQARELLALVAPDDRQVLQLAIIDGLDGHELAERLGVTPGTARMRLHRALTRLRVAWAEREAAQSQEGAAAHDA